MSWTILHLDLATVNAAFSRVGAFLSKLGRDGSLADAALSPNIPRYSDEALKPFVPVLGASAGTLSSAAYSAWYSLRGDIMQMDCYFIQCTLNNTPNYLTVDIPAGWLVSNSATVNLFGSACPYSDNGTTGTGIALANAAGSLTQIRIFKNVAGAGNFAVSAAATVFAFQLEFRVRRP